MVNQSSIILCAYCAKASTFSSESMYSYYLQSLQRLYTKVCKYFRPESLQRLSEGKSFADFRRGESICRLSWKVFADFGGNNPRLSQESPYLVFQGEIICLDFHNRSINYI